PHPRAARAPVRFPATPATDSESSCGSVLSCCFGGTRKLSDSRPILLALPGEACALGRPPGNGQRAASDAYSVQGRPSCFPGPSYSRRAAPPKVGRRLLSVREALLLRRRRGLRPPR